MSDEQCSVEGCNSKMIIKNPDGKPYCLEHTETVREQARKKRKQIKENWSSDI